MQSPLLVRSWRNGREVDVEYTVIEALYATSKNLPNASVDGSDSLQS